MNGKENGRERVIRYYKDYKNAVENLAMGVQNAVDDLSIDGTIKRFELCYELAWKLIKEVLADRGIICKNPRDCFKEAFSNQLIDNQESWLEMIKDRNLLVHTYDASVSREVFENIEEKYLSGFQFLLKKIEEELSSD